MDILWTGLHKGLYVPTLKVTLEEGASLILIECCTGEGAYWMNGAAEFDLKDNARLVHIRIQEDSVDAVNTTFSNISLGRDAHYDSFTLNLGGKLTRHEIHGVLNGPGAEIHLNGLNLLKNKQHGDTTILIEHKAPHCQSNQFYRSILDDEAHGVFQGKVYVHQEAQKTDGYQLSNALLLSPKAEMDTKPELEIYADDVKCSHGATTGQLDDEPLFYLRSRGLSEKEARLLLIQAFVDEVVDKIVDEKLREAVAAKSSDWLNSVL
ncbi:MAG: Fe-S cluster assembly protein SufD [Alphaproteobacteria bacterium]|nr:Fe-S cluster assembly protein SufD [Alphaproteobacteria bacterium]